MSSYPNMYETGDMNTPPSKGSLGAIPDISQPGSQHSSVSSNTFSERLPTEFYEVGDMNRAYLEGMVPSQTEAPSP